MVAGTNSTVFINEFHYDNDGTDTGEFIEIANTGGTDLAGWSLVLYNGSATQLNVYDTIALSGSAQLSSISFPSNGIQNGSPDGFALVDAADTVVQFLSYEGSFTAASGPAAGQTSTDIGVEETSSTPAGFSLQLSGSGSIYGDFIWGGPAAATLDAPNTGQTLVGGGGGDPVVFINELHYDNDGTDAGEFVEVAGTAGADLTGWSIALYNGSSTQLNVYDTIALSGTIDDEGAGFGALSFASAGIQNGSPDGLALVDADGNVVQFLSYEGSFTAATGPAAGLTSEDIGTEETSSTPVGFSLQLTGSGSAYEDFAWQAPADDSPGDLNADQSFGAGGAGTLSIGDVSQAEGDSGTTTFSFAVTRTGGSTGAASVDYNVLLNGSADADDLSGPLSGTVSFADGETSATIEIAVNGDTEAEPTETFDVALTNATGGASIGDGSGTGTGTIVDDDGFFTPIYDIQGAAHTSPLLGQAVTTRGIVTAVDSNGFFFQDATGDGDIATSDGLFVFTSSAPGVAVGDEVSVDGTVSEFFPGGAGTGNLSTTQITSPSMAVLSSGNALPAAVILGAAGRTPPTEVIEDDNFTSFDPETDGIDFYESLEGMLVTIDDPLAVAGTTRFGEIYTVADNGANATNLSERGTINIRTGEGALGTTNVGAGSDFNPERIQIDADSTITPGGTPDIATGAQLEDVTGVVGYNFGNFEVIPTEAITVRAESVLLEETTNLAGDANHLTVSTYNVLNLDPNDSDGDTDVADGKFTDLGLDIVNGLGSPDIIALQEVQDNSGSTNDGTVSASVTLQMLADAIVAAGGPVYSVLDNPFIGNNSSGGQPGANIRTAFLYRADRVDLVEGSVRSIQETDQQTDPDNPFFGARLPLVATFGFNGAEVTVVNNHFSSKGGSDPLFGANQPPANGSFDERLAQAQAVADFVGTEQESVDRIVVFGDLNEFEDEEPLDPLYDAGLTNLVNGIDEVERYSFNFEGNSQQLDHIFVSEALTGGSEFDIVHLNTEFAAADAASDHDPLLASLFISGAARLFELDDNDNNFPNTGDDNSGNDTIIAFDGNDTVDGGEGDDVLLGGDGNDRLFGGVGNDTLQGSSGNDTMIGSTGDDTYYVNLPTDVVIENAGEGTDLVQAYIDYTLGDNLEQLRLRGNARSGTGNDLDNLLIGTGGDDVLTGGAASDTLTGGGGADSFVIGEGETGDSIATADSITDFSQTDNDNIDLSAIDADANIAGEQAFTFVGTDAFSGTAGELRYERAGGDTLVFGDTDGDGIADLAIRIESRVDLVASDFVL